MSEAITTTGFDECERQIALADPSQHTKEIEQVIYKGLNIIRERVISSIDDAIPYRQYPNKHDARDYHEHGVLRYRQYGKLSHDVKRSVSQDASGGSVSIYSRRNTENRWCVLQWLNAGTLERSTGGRTHILSDGTAKFEKKWHGGAQQSRGQIKALNFFLPAAQAGIAGAETYILANVIEIITPNND